MSNPIVLNEDEESDSDGTVVPGGMDTHRIDVRTFLGLDVTLRPAGTDTDAPTDPRGLTLCQGSGLT